MKKKLVYPLLHVLQVAPFLLDSIVQYCIALILLCIIFEMIMVGIEAALLHRKKHIHPFADLAGTSTPFLFVVYFIIRAFQEKMMISFDIQKLNMVFLVVIYSLLVLQIYTAIKVLRKTDQETL